LVPSGEFGMSADENLDIIRRGMEVLQEEGRHAWYGYMEGHASPELEYCPIIVPGVDGEPLKVGFREMKIYLERLNDLYPDFAYADPAVEAKGENVVILVARLRPRGVEGDESPLTWTVFEFEEGLVRRIYSYADEDGALRHAEAAAS
jgi:hypothetical protein